MIDLKLIREKPDSVREAIATLQLTAPIDEILALDEERRALVHEVEQLKARRNQVSKEIGRLHGAPEAECELRRLVAEIDVAAQGRMHRRRPQNQTDQAD